MINVVKKLVKQVLPSAWLEAYQVTHQSHGWMGDFSTWAEAQQASTGYDSTIILEKVKNALLRVKNGQAIYERDSVLFDQVNYSWPLLAGLMWVAAQKEGKLDVLDFGGSLGSTYFQNRLFLKDLKTLQWNIVEQERFVRCGKTFFEDEQLKFFYTIDECLKEAKPDVMLLSCVLPYVEKPYQLLATILSYQFEFLFFDRMPYIHGSRDRLTIQKVHPEIYTATYPAWFFSESKLIQFLNHQYEIVCDFHCEDIANIPSHFKGMLLKIRK
jgi:putative methyltransferase (TIGR04325 family)